MNTNNTIGFKGQLRRDRSGSQFYCLISQLLYSISHSKKLYINRKKNNSLLKPLFEKVELFTGQVGLQKLVGLRNTALKLTREIKLDLITYAKQKLNLTAQKPSQINFKTRQIVIHVRNGDSSKEPIHDGFKVHEYCKNLVENKDQVYNRNEMNKLGSDRQCPTSESALDKVLSKVCLKHPEKEVHLVSENKSFSSRKYKNISEKYNIKFFSSDINTDFYHLATSDILIGSRSSFCIMALYHFTGKDFFYPHWSLYTCLGLGTKYDQTNYQSFRNI
jgi:hypothetical protein